MITTDDYDDREVCYENEEEGISKTYKVCNSDDIDTMLENAKDDYLWEEKRTVPEHVRCYVDWDTMAVSVVFTTFMIIAMCLSSIVQLGIILVLSL